MTLTAQMRRSTIEVYDDAGVINRGIELLLQFGASPSDRDRAEAAADRVDLGALDAAVAATAADSAAAILAKDAAELARDEAETARDASLLSDGIYASTSAGLAAVALGRYFSVPTLATGEFIQLYRHDSGPVATAIGEPYPSVAAIADKIGAVEGNEYGLTDDNGLGQAFPNVFANNRTLNVGASWKASLATGQAGIYVVDELTGLATLVAEPNLPAETTGAAADALWSADEYAYVEGRALAEALRLNSQDVSGFAKRAVDAAAARVLRIGTGQSFMAGSGQARLFLSASRLALLGLATNPALSVGPDSRCVNDGATYTTFGGSTTLTPLVENFIAPTNTDLIYTATEVSTGDYPVNARGGTPEVVRDILTWIFRNRWNLQADTTMLSWTTVAMNHAKTDGSIAEVGTGDGLSRLYSLIAVFVTATTGTRLCDVIDLNHGEADEAAATATYAADVATYLDAIWTRLQAATPSGIGQTVRPVTLTQQVGGPRYGTAAMVAANAQVDMMLDLTGTEASVFLVGCKYEVPNLYFFDQAEYSGFPNSSIWDNNGHPTLAGNVLMGIRSAVALHYIQDRNEPYWVPFPYEVYFSGNKFLLSIPSKAPPLRAVDMVCGVETYMRNDLGITFENGGGSDNPVTFARVVQGYKTLIEGECASDIAGFLTMKTGKRTSALSISGFTNIRDSFNIDLPFELPFDRNQTVFPLETTDNPTLNGLGRWLEAIPGWVGKPDLGNPCARRTLTAIPMPSV